GIAAPIPSPMECKTPSILESIGPRRDRNRCVRALRFRKRLGTTRRDRIAPPRNHFGTRSHAREKTPPPSGTILPRNTDCSGRLGRLARSWVWIARIGSAGGVSVDAAGAIGPVGRTPCCGVSRRAGTDAPDGTPNEGRRVTRAHPLFRDARVH